MESSPVPASMADRVQFRQNGMVRFTNGLSPDRAFNVWVPQYAPLLAERMSKDQYGQLVRQRNGVCEVVNPTPVRLVVAARLTLADLEPGEVLSTHARPTTHRAEAVKWLFDLNNWSGAIGVVRAAPEAERPALMEMVREANQILRPLAAEDGNLLRDIQVLNQVQ